MQTFNPRVLDNLIHKFLTPYIVEDSLKIEEWDSYTGIHSAPGVIELDGKPHIKMHPGDEWRVGMDDTRFFEADIAVPSHFEGRRVYLTLEFGGEALVYINGKIAGAVSSRENSGWVGRNEILFPNGVKAGEKLHIKVESGVDWGGLFNAATLSGKNDMRYEITCSSLDMINEDAEALCFDMYCAWDTYKNTEDRYVAKRIYNAMDTAMHMLDFDLGKEAFYKTVPAAREYFWKKMDSIKSATPGDVILAGHSHLDVAWLWTVNEITRKCARTFSNNLALMDAYPDFRFTQSQAAVYYFTKQYYPELFERVKQKVKEGAWEITGNTWVEADTNIASGESLVRQLLYGREFFMREFGVSSDIYWLPDCFGFTAALPQIIKRSGMKYFITSKLQYNDTNEFPVSVYRWRSHSGDDVLAYMQKVSYNGEADPGYIINARRTNLQNDLVDVSMGMFGYGDGGGGCTYNMVERARRSARMPGMPGVRLGTAKEFFAEAEKNYDELPVWDGEMYYENHRGTFTSQAFVKKNNRRGEFMMRNLEFLSLLAGTYNQKTLDGMWITLLTNQFHDILPGTSIHEVFENTRKEYASLNEQGEKLKNEAVSLIAEKCVEGGNKIFVFNPVAFECSNTVKAYIPEGFNAVGDSSGKLCNSSCGSDEKGSYIEFCAENVPSMGYKIFTLANAENNTPCVRAEKNLLENEYLRVEISPDGEISSVYDKENGREVLTGSGNVLTLSHDKPIHESAWNLENDYMMHMVRLDRAESICVVESSALRGAVRVVKKINKSTVTQDYVLFAGERKLRFETSVDWHEKEKVLKAEFPVCIRSRYSTFEIAHGATERPTFANNSFEKAQFECCAHKWTDLSETDYGVSLLNDCKYGYDITGNVMRITLMRAPVCPDLTADLGENSFVYELYPHKNGWDEAGTVNEALRLNVPFESVFISEGKAVNAVPEKSFVSVDNRGIVVDAVMRARDDSGIIIRMYQSSRRKASAVITTERAFAKAVECNLMEQEENEIPLNGNSFELVFKPFEVKTIKLI